MNFIGVESVTNQQKYQSIKTRGAKFLHTYFLVSFFVFVHICSETANNELKGDLVSLPKIKETEKESTSGKQKENSTKQRGTSGK